MSATSDCSCSCPSPVVTEIPGTEGDGGGAGTDGVSAFTTTDGVAGPFDAGDTGITITVADTSMFSVGQYVAIEDVNGANPGFFQITALAANQLTLTYLDIGANGDAKSIATTKAVSPSGPPFTLGALPAVLVDASTGTAGNNIAAGVGITQLHIPHTFIGGTSAVEPLTNYTVGFKFKILSWVFVTEVLLVGAAGSRVANLEIGTTDVGTVVSTCTIPIANAAVGTVTEATAVSGANTGSASDTLSIEIASGGTQFTAGSGTFIITIQNMDTADAIASIADKINDLINTTLA